MWSKAKDIISSDLGWFGEDLVRKAQEGSMDAIFKIARLYEQGLKIKQDDLKAVELFELCSEAGMVDAKIRLADNYFRGNSVKHDSEKAKRLLNDAIFKNRIMAYILLGDILNKEGKKLEAIKNYLEAEKIFLNDDQGISDYTMAIMYSGLSTLYLSEEENIRNPNLAVKYMDKALEEDVFCNAKIIGDLFFYGKGVEKDYERAKFYYRRIVDEETCNTCGCDCLDYCVDKLISISAAEVWESRKNC